MGVKQLTNFCPRQLDFHYWKNSEKSRKLYRWLQVSSITSSRWSRSWRCSYVGQLASYNICKTVVLFKDSFSIADLWHNSYNAECQISDSGSAISVWINIGNAGIHVGTGLSKMLLDGDEKRGAMNTEIFSTSKDDKERKGTLQVKFRYCKGVPLFQQNFIWFDLIYPHLISFRTWGSQFQPNVTHSCMNQYLSRW